MTGPNRFRFAALLAVAGAALSPATLAARGLGPLAPLASNGAEDGQARNRRVELVEM